MSNPSSYIWICSGVRLSPSYEHTFYFESKEAQESYFHGKVVKTFPSYTYLRKEWTIKVQATMSETLGWNYLFFKNVTGDNKYYYYFINKVEYVNDNTVELFLEMDVMQTFYFDYGVLASYVDRCHASTDVIGDNIIEEGLELGEYMSHHTHRVVELDELAIVVASTVDLNEDYNFSGTDNTYTTATSTTIDGVFSGVELFVCSYGNVKTLIGKLNKLDKWGQSDAIISMYMFPRNCIAFKTPESETDLGKVNGFYPRSEIATFTPQTKLGTYVPRNNKLFTYPYNFLYLTNNNGETAVYRYEFSKASDHSIVFSVDGSVLPEGGVKIFPKNYAGLSAEWYEAGLALTSFPTCIWNTDVYKLWLAQNQNAHKLAGLETGVKIGGGAISALASAFTGNVIGAMGGIATMYSGATQIAGMVAERKDREIQPAQAKGSFSSTLNVGLGQNSFLFYDRCVRPDMASRIDDYFSMYGYKQNRVMDINFKTNLPRMWWAYLKTVDCQAYGNIPSNYLEQIRGIYNKGLTFWKEPENLGKYTYHGYMENPIAG